MKPSGWVGGVKRASFGLVFGLAAAFGMLLVSAPLARADDSDDSTGPVAEFSQQLENFQKSVPALNKTIQDSAGAIDTYTDAAKARAEVDKLREAVSGLLGAVSDNGPVSQLGVKALNHVHDKLRTLAQESRFKPEERQFLIDQWLKLQDQTESATKDLDDARAQFVALLQTLQSNEDFITELLEIRQAQKALEVIRSLTHDIRDASSQLNRLIGGIKPPGA
jgi:DNA repair exonuclease SbcCD ATPase subunit